MGERLKSVLTYGSAVVAIWIVAPTTPALAAIGDGQSPATAGLSAKQILTDGYSMGDGIYWIDPDGNGGNAPFQAFADMTRDGGGWTLVLKTWYQAGHFRNPNAVGAISDALTLKGSPYKLSDESIRGLIGSSNNFDVLAEQNGYNSSYSSGNYEYAILRNYTGEWTWEEAMDASLTPTTLESRRRADSALAWTGELLFGAGGAGINGSVLLNGLNPAGGSGCDINMGTQSNVGWHHFFMADTNSDSYLYLCNGAQHSSGHNMNHLYWVRSKEIQTMGSSDSDDDSVADDVDNCPTTPNLDQADGDGDGIGDVCDVCASDPDNDADADGVCGDLDSCPIDANADQTDTDRDGAGDACDVDDDNDTVADAADNCPLDANTNQADADGDGFGNVCDADDDNDGVIDGADLCVPTAAGQVVNADGCAIADLCPCDNDWKNHGAYVSCVAHASEDFVDFGLITGSEKDAIVSAAGQSSCGKKK